MQPNGGFGAPGVMELTGRYGRQYVCPFAGVAASRLTFRRLDYWARSGLVGPSGMGSGNHRSWSPREIERIAVIAHLVDKVGLSLQQCRLIPDVDLADQVVVCRGATISVVPKGRAVALLVEGADAAVIPIGHIVERVRLRIRQFEQWVRA